LRKLTIAEYHFVVLIIWRSLVQAQAGPHLSQRLTFLRKPLFLVSS